MVRARRLLTLAAAAMLALSPTACGDDSAGDGGSRTVKIGVGGKSLMVYLPTTLADELGYFTDEGLDVTFDDLEGGSKALQALQGGSVDVVNGFYEHTIQMQAKGRDLTAFVAMLRYPSMVLAVSPKASKEIKAVEDLQGAKVGVTAPGSSTDFFLKYLLSTNGLELDAASVHGIGGDTKALAAVESGQVDAAVLLEPAFSLLQKRAGEGGVRVLEDTRTEAGVREVFDVSTYPSAVLYSNADWVDENRETARKMAKAIVRALNWIEQHSAQEIADKMPEEYSAGEPEVYVAALDAAKDAYSQDGRVSTDGAEAVARVLGLSIPEVAETDIDVSKTFTNEFVEE
ncbi:ABC transporter substrate-binding protein [Catenuloplanes atrovinosus]|uniref:NitT/TauT family transport system substrate-binding protein n=1 Tax=Catenuloplanes atrovinosus TaxID=137266 RepID=A0AAE3YJN5_9ACTN|nr:ABC transporter substrate-binding protein [Catenuloplanes atrovinosus]MDR7274999.1 NitT/TauT family transport system substrate-binding protein [Catenuloplanes atrovinosus]